MRESVMKKIPYALIIGQKEVEASAISYRKCGTEETITLAKEEFINMILSEIKNKGN